MLAVSDKPHSEYCVDDIYCLNHGTCYIITAIGRKFCEYVLLTHAYSYVNLVCIFIHIRICNVPFLTCVRTLTHVIAIGWTSVRPSVRILYKNGSTYRQTVFTPGSPMILVLRSKLFPGIPMEIPPSEALNARGRKKLQFPTNISL